MGKIQGFYPSLLLWAVHSRNCEGILILNGTSFLQIWTAPKVPKAEYECNKSIEDDGSFLCLRYASQMRSERRHHGPTEASSTRQNSEASQPFFQPTGSVALKLIDSRETLAYNTPWFAVNHGTMVCPMPPATGWNARPHPPHTCDSLG